MNRRNFNKIALSSLLPLSLQASPRAGAKVKRFICLGNSLGVCQHKFWPKKFGRNFEVRETLKPLASLKSDISLFGKMSHGVKGGHVGQSAILTTILQSQAPAYKDGMQSLDQRIAAEFGVETKFPSLVLGLKKQEGYPGALSWTRSGTLIPTTYSPAKVFEDLFAPRSLQQRKLDEYRLDQKASILDGLVDDMKSMGRNFSKVDKGRAGEYLDSIRAVEKSIQKSRYWLHKPAPEIEMDKVVDSLDDPQKTLKDMVDLTVLALKSDLTRVATIDLDSNYHALSHHGKLEDKVKDLVAIEQNQMQGLARLISQLKEQDDVQNPGDKMIDNTIVLFLSGLGSGNSHSNENLPVILAGGGFDHGRYVNADTRLGHLFVSILNNLGIQGAFKDYHKPFSGY